MRADCVPIYWGADNVTAYIPPEAFVDRRSFRSNEDLSRFLIAMSEAEYNQYRAAIRGYLQSEQFALFLEPAFVEQIVRVLRFERS